MRRLLTLACVILVACTTALVASATADDTHTYKVELDNAFGLVTDSEVRIAGVPAGIVADLDINKAKRAVVTIEISGELSSLRESATCSSEPQSLIAEYFLDCQPGTRGPYLEEGEMIPVRSEKYGNQTFTTVQNDVVNNTFREPFKDRFALLLNEFGTALAGNPDNLNEAIRRGAPALRALDSALAILARQNSTIAQLNVDSDQIISRLTERRDDVIDFIENANRTSTASAAVRGDLARNFELLPGFLQELRPSLAALGNLAEQQTPLLADLNATAPQLNRLTRTLPPFNAAAEPATRTLGTAANFGRVALNRGRDEIRALRQAARGSFNPVDQLANFLIDLDDPNRAVEVDSRAARDTGRDAPTGYTGLEGLLNYVYYQTGAINQFDSIGHLLHFTILEFEAGPCGHYNAGPTVPAAGGGETRSAANKNRCVSWVGPSQFGINKGINQEPYHPSVCPDGSSDEDLCDSNARNIAIAPSTTQRTNEGVRDGDGAAGAEDGSEAGGDTGTEDGAEGPVPGEEIPEVVPGVPGIPGLPTDPGSPDNPTDITDLEDLLGVGADAAQGDEDVLAPREGGSAAADQALLDFLFGN